MISPKLQYPAQVVSSDPGYPHGMARNEQVAGDRNGTPLEERWLNDLWGFQQALVVDAGITPNNIPDKVGASQMLTALKRVVEAQRAAKLPPTVAIPLQPYPENTNGDPWEIFSDGSGSRILRQTGGGAAIGGALSTNPAIIPVVFPYSNIRIKENGIRMWLKGESGHSGLPGTRPRLIFVERPFSNMAAPIQHVSKNDDAPDLPTYESLHSVTSTNTPIEINAGSQYHVHVRGEGATPREVGLLIYAVTFDIEAIPES